MKELFFTPGPSQLYPSVVKHLQSALEKNIFSVSHRSLVFQNIYSNTVEQIKKLLVLPDDYSVFFLSSATEAMERIIENGVEQKSFHFVNGAFSSKFYQIAGDLKKRPKKFEVEPGNGFNFEKMQIEEKPELICFTHNETSTGVELPLEEIYAVKKKNPMSFIAIDIVSSAPYVSIDATQFDYIFFSVQKGFGLPAGLGVLIVSPRALEKSHSLHKKAYNIGSYHSFLQLEKYGLKFQTPITPNVLAIYILGKVAEDMLQKGLHAIRDETESKARLLYEFIDNYPDYSSFVIDKSNRSKTVIVVKVAGGSDHVVKQLKEKGIVVGKGYKQFKEEQIRIANFPAHSVDEVRKLIQLLDFA